MNMKWIADLKLKTKLLLVFIPPLLGFLAFGGVLLTEKMEELDSLNEVEELSELAVNASALVHELQKERGMSAGFLGSGGKNFAGQLPGQRSQSDERLKDLNGYLGSREFADAVNGKVSRAKDDLNRLSAMRSNIDGLSVPVAEAVGYYTGMIGELIAIVDEIVQVGTDKEISVASASFAAYLQMKERAGIERAVLSSTFGNEGFKPGVFNRAVKLMSEQESYAERFGALASASQQQSWAALKQRPEIAEVERYRQIALSQDNSAIAATSAEAWFKASTERINLLYDFEKSLGRELNAITDLRLERAQSMFFMVLTAVIAIMALVSFTGLSVMGYLYRTIGHIESKMRRAKEDFDLSTRIKLDSHDEFGRLGRAFNGMMGDFEAVIEQVRRNSHTVTEAVRRMESYSTQMRQDVAKGHSEAEQVASAMTEMSATVSQIASNAVEAASASTKANLEAKTGNDEVGHTTSTITHLAREIDDAASALMRLDDDIKGIVSVLEVISSIAEQTNLLALNAAIEAARAGEMGRGFAVVADEVRSLAQRAQASTTDIRNMTERLKSGAKVAVDAMARGQVQAQASVTEVERAGEELRRIVDYVGVIDSMNEQIATATHEQSAVAEEVNRNALRISEIYQSTHQVADELAKVNDDLLDAVNAMSNQVSKFSLSDSGRR
ncbi:methyl-accepting chemotaxis protein [Shewanella sp. JM162201]|uniref:Methyl-accepting chemotaxis protein n=1 Tax=Shewanella jiangmenensis TaxID=2837387 RepID=A0ABS5V913_9GAMM|nr:methyl-accepting chemotaxis protein [Shewanella jiangmenensis]MBT1445513.1 methyl-accepting chemotaxis protein [Shewanella jiangmenensis]